MWMMQVSQLDGVYSVQQPHFWTLCTNVYVGGLKVEVSPTADTKFIISHTHNIFAAVNIATVVTYKFNFNQLYYYRLQEPIL